MGSTRSLSILSNTRWFDGRSRGGQPAAAHDLPADTLPATIRALIRRPRLDAGVFNVASRELLVACALRKLLLPRMFLPRRLVSVDLILRRPATFKQKLRHPLMRWLLQEVDLFLLYYKDTVELRALYDIPPHRVRYIPFKVNDLEQILQTETTDEGFFLACGRSNRDYRTLCRAFEGLPYTAKILAPLGPEAARHGTIFDAATCPNNVTVVRDDGSAISWIDWIARARCLILPVTVGMLSPSGIGTYLVAMALGKCVIMTEGPATRGLLDDTTAVLVPPSDPLALRRAVVAVNDDQQLRNRIAQAGQRYALSLGDEQRLADDVWREVLSLLGDRTGS